MPETRIVARSPEMNLLQAMRILRALRQRYETERNGNANACFLSIQVALGYTDMPWITATIEALERTITAGATENGTRDLRETVRKNGIVGTFHPR